MNGDQYTQTNLDSMKHLKRFNENSHDWRANAFPGATEEEIEAEIQKIEAERAKNPQAAKPAPKAVPAKQMTEEEEENYYRATGWATGDYGQYRNQSTDSKEQEEEIEEEKPTLGSKIKSFFGFNK